MSATAPHAAAADKPTGTFNHHWWSERIEHLAGELGRLHRLTRETPVSHRVDRICLDAWTLLNEFKLTAADRVRAGMDVEEALRETERETQTMDRLLGIDKRLPS